MKCKTNANKSTAHEVHIQFRLKGGAEILPAAETQDDLISRANRVKKNPELLQGVTRYAGEIKSAVEEHFHSASSYKGNVCTLRITLNPDGLLLGVHAESGDATLCQASVKAIQHAEIPKPPSADIYDVFKNIAMDFRP